MISVLLCRSKGIYSYQYIKKWMPGPPEKRFKCLLYNYKEKRSLIRGSLDVNDGRHLYFVCNDNHIMVLPREDGYLSACTLYIYRWFFSRFPGDESRHSPRRSLIPGNPFYYGFWCHFKMIHRWSYTFYF